MTQNGIITKVSDLSSDLFFLTKDDFFQGSDVSPLAMVLKNYLENVSFTLDKFSDALDMESGEEE